MDGAVAECTPEQVNRNIDGATITSIASVYAHTVFAEDFIVHMMLQGKPPIYEAQGWSKKLNVAPSGAPPSINPEWAKAIKMDVPSFQQYAKEVYAASDAYVASLPDAELEQAALDVAQKLAKGPPLAMAEAKRLVYRSLGETLERQLEDEREAIQRSAATQDFAEGVSAFLEKRGANFQGR